MRRLVVWTLLIALLGSSWPERARANQQEPLPYSEEARIERLKEVAAAHTLTFPEARHAADTQLLTGALLIIGSIMTPLFAQLRDEDFPTYASILVGSIGFAVLMEGTIDEQRANRRRLKDQIEQAEMNSAAKADSLAAESQKLEPQSPTPSPPPDPQ
jgi:hypothetical protein